MKKHIFVTLFLLATLILTVSCLATNFQINVPNVPSLIVSPITSAVQKVVDILSDSISRVGSSNPAVSDALNNILQRLLTIVQDVNVTTVQQLNGVLQSVTDVLRDGITTSARLFMNSNVIGNPQVVAMLSFVKIALQTAFVTLQAALVTVQGITGLLSFTG